MTSWLQHTFRERRPIRIQRQVVALAALAIFIAILMGALYLAQSASVATMGRQVEDLIVERNQLQQVNEQLRAEISGYRTVSRLIARAEALGFVQADESEIEYLYVANYNPQRVQNDVVVINNPEVNADTEEVPAVTYEESFAGWVQEQWDNLMQQISTFSGGG
jgi:cell division protein FtsB